MCIKLRLPPPSRLEVLSGFLLVALVAQRLNVAVRVLVSERQRDEVVDAPAAGCLARPALSPPQPCRSRVLPAITACRARLVRTLGLPSYAWWRSSLDEPLARRDSRRLVSLSPSVVTLVGTSDLVSRRAMSPADTPHGLQAPCLVRRESEKSTTAST